MTRRPRIGLTLDHDDARGRYELKRAYVDAVLAAGGLPVLLPHDGAVAGAYLALLDGLVVTGGAFDVDPSLYGEARRPACGPTKPERTAFERDLLEAALAARLPVLGVCGGMQLLNVVRGGTLYQDLVADAGVRGHEQPPPKDVPSHEARITPGSLLAGLVGGAPLPVNSTHHQAVRDPGAGVLVSARAPDGVVEAIELPDLPFAIGVQWHPEAAGRHEPRRERAGERGGAEHPGLHGAGPLRPVEERVELGEQHRLARRLEPAGAARALRRERRRDRPAARADGGERLEIGEEAGAARRVEPGDDEHAGRGRTGARRPHRRASRAARTRPW